MSHTLHYVFNSWVLSCVQCIQWQLYTKPTVYKQDVLALYNHLYSLPMPFYTDYLCIIKIQTTRLIATPNYSRALTTVARDMIGIRTRCVQVSVTFTGHVTHSIAKAEHCRMHWPYVSSSRKNTSGRLTTWKHVWHSSETCHVGGTEDSQKLMVVIDVYRELQLTAVASGTGVPRDFLSGKAHRTSWGVE